jgi:hypothetical protein
MSGNEKTGDKKPEIPSGLDEESPHYYGHRERLRERFRGAGSDAVTDYELLELLLFRALPRRDVKPLAKELIARFGSFAEVVSAPVERLAEIKGLGDSAITELKVVQAAANRLARGQVKKRPVLSSGSTIAARHKRSPTRSSSACCFWTSATSSSPMKCSRSARWTTPRSIRAKWSSARSNSPRPRSSWCTTIPLRGPWSLSITLNPFESLALLLIFTGGGIGSKSAV